MPKHLGTFGAYTTVLVLLVVLALASHVTTNASCTFKNDNQFYDLSPMTRLGSESDFFAYDSKNRKSYYVNICASTRAACDNNQAVCVQEFLGAHLGYGLPSRVTFMPYRRMSDTARCGRVAAVLVRALTGVNTSFLLPIRTPPLHCCHVLVL
jgi:hypothetical protein